MPIDSTALDDIVPSRSLFFRHNPNASEKGKRTTAQRKRRRAADPEYREQILAANREWRKKNREKYNKSRRDIRARRLAVIQQYKAEHPCIRCGEADIVCLDFHHRDPSTKTINTAIMHRHAMSVAKIMAEIAKCDILCANCHRKLHAEERLAY